MQTGSYARRGNQPETLRGPSGTTRSTPVGADDQSHHHRRTVRCSAAPVGAIRIARLRRSAPCKRAARLRHGPSCGLVGAAKEVIGEVGAANSSVAEARRAPGRRQLRRLLLSLRRCRVAADGCQEATAAGKTSTSPGTATRRVLGRLHRRKQRRPPDRRASLWCDRCYSRGLPFGALSLARVTIVALPATLIWSL